LDCGTVFSGVVPTPLGQSLENIVPALSGVGTPNKKGETEKDGSLSTIEETIESWLKFSRASDQSETNFALCLSEVTRVAMALRLPREVTEKASTICRDAFWMRLAKGRTIRRLSCAATYVACRRGHVGITLHEVTKVSGTDISRVGQLVGILQRHLNLEMPEPDLRSFLARILSQLPIDQEIRVRLSREAQILIERITASKITVGKDPRGIACGILYLVSREIGLTVTQRQLSSVADVTETTIRNRVSQITQVMSEELEPFLRVKAQFPHYPRSAIFL